MLPSLKALKDLSSEAVGHLIVLFTTHLASLAEVPPHHTPDGQTENLGHGIGFLMDQKQCLVHPRCAQKAMKVTGDGWVT